MAEAAEPRRRRLYANVRWQNLAFNLAPMLGLLGTIRGVIVAFHGTANLPANMNKTVYLADGIYQALVNTFAGIAVAVPAAIFRPPPGRPHHETDDRGQRLRARTAAAIGAVRGAGPRKPRRQGGAGAAPAPPQVTLLGDAKPKQPAVQPQ